MTFLSERTTEELEAERERLDEQVRRLNEDIRDINSELFRRTTAYARMFPRGARPDNVRDDGEQRG